MYIQIGRILSDLFLLFLLVSAILPPLRRWVLSKVGVTYEEIKESMESDVNRYGTLSLWDKIICVLLYFVILPAVILIAICIAKFTITILYPVIIFFIIANYLLTRNKSNK